MAAPQNRHSPVMDSSSDPPQQDAVAWKHKRGPPFAIFVPLIYAPILPVIRIALRKNPVLRDRLFYGVLAGAFGHGLYLITDLYDTEKK